MNVSNRWSFTNGMRFRNNFHTRWRSKHSNKVLRLKHSHRYLLQHIFLDIVATESNIIYFWVCGQWLNIPLASNCLLTCSPIWATGQYACRSRRNIESYPTINYTAFSCNNMSKSFYCQILADGFVLNLKSEKNSRYHFSCWYSIIGHEVVRL